MESEDTSLAHFNSLALAIIFSCVATAMASNASSIPNPVFADVSKYSVPCSAEMNKDR